MSTDVERSDAIWNGMYYILPSQDPFPEGSRASTIIQCVGHIAFDVCRVDQESLEENSGYWAL